MLNKKVREYADYQGIPRNNVGEILLTATESDDVVSSPVYGSAGGTYDLLKSKVKINENDSFKTVVEKLKTTIAELGDQNEIDYHDEVLGKMVVGYKTELITALEWLTKE